MTDGQISGIGIDAGQQIGGIVKPRRHAEHGAEGKDFKSYLLDSLDKVNQLQNEADAGVQKLLTGETDNVAEVLSVSRKAGVAFDLLMEIRNKLMDAYSELKQMRT